MDNVIEILCVIGGFVSFMFYILLSASTDNCKFYSSSVLSVMTVCSIGGLIFCIGSCVLPNVDVVMYGLGWMLGMLVSIWYPVRTDA